MMRDEARSVVHELSKTLSAERMAMIPDPAEQESISRLLPASIPIIGGPPVRSIPVVRGSPGAPPKTPAPRSEAPKEVAPKRLPRQRHPSSAVELDLNQEDCEPGRSES